MELDNDLLTKKQIFVLMSIYAMGVGEWPEAYMIFRK
jgi:hypothetical protein